jgi:hypothetical protein
MRGTEEINMPDHWGSTLFVLSLYFFVPIFLAKMVLGASWNSVLIAYGIWIAVLLVFGLTSSGTWGEAIGWPLIFGLFLTIPAISILVLILRFASVR